MKEEQNIFDGLISGDKTPKALFLSLLPAADDPAHSMKSHPVRNTRPAVSSIATSGAAHGLQQAVAGQRERVGR